MTWTFPPCQCCSRRDNARNPARSRYGPPVTAGGASTVEQGVPWVVVLLAAGAAELLPDHRVQLQFHPPDSDPVTVRLWTRYEDVGLPALLPRELVLEVRLQAADTDAAVRTASAVAGNLGSLLSFAVNAHVAPAEAYLAYECAPGLTRRRFWQQDVDFQQGLPGPRRLIDQALLFPLLNAVFGSGELPRLSRALGQYDAALGHWTTQGRPLALADLYIALEALGPAAERAERQRLGLPGEREHAAHRGVDLSRSNWRSELLSRVRRDVLCQGDKQTYDAALEASNGLEHGYMPLSEYQAAAAQHARALLDHVRAAVLSLLDLPEEVRGALAAKRPLDVSPPRQEIAGELHGDVQDPDGLGEAGQPHPYADWRTTLAGLERQPDGRLRVQAQVDLTWHLAQGVLMTATSHGLGVGLTDPDLFDYDPLDGAPVVVRRDARTRGSEPDGDELR